ncbi:MAG: hypothetical protein LBF71_05965, partial [Campylobacteraceae bacterium]|nr:hypothetical protein [Campylobacteraceae bacterium]
GVDSSAGWNPIGDNTAKFTGIFSGNGNKISGLWINRTSTDYVGLFGYTQNAQIKNIGVEASEIRGNIFVGGIAGIIYHSSSVANSYSTGSIFGNTHVGGIAGNPYDNSNVTNSYSTANVSGNNYVGGIAGYVYGSSSVTDSYSTGTISGDYVGGIAGVVESSSAVTNNAAINPSVTGTSGVNRVVGYIYSSTVTNNFALGSMSGKFLRRQRGNI